MKLERLHIQNFQSLGEIEFDFPKGLVLIDGWNEDIQSHNGVGKSALLNAITYAIYGKLPKNITVKELVRQGTSGMSTEIDLDVNGKRIKIIRERSSRSGKLTLLVDFEEVKGLAKDVEIRIPELIGLTFEQFIQVVYVFQGADRRFINLNDTEKKKFLSTLLDLDVYDNSYKIAHSKLTSVELDIAKFTGSLESIEQNIVTASEELKVAREAEATFLGTQEALTQAIQNKVQSVKATVAELEAEKVQSKNSTELVRLAAKKGEILQIIQKNKENLSQIASISVQIKSLGGELARFIKMRDKPESTRCGECGQSMPGWSLQEHTNRVENNILMTEQQIKDLNLTKEGIRVVDDSKLDVMLQKVMNDIATERAQGPERFDPLIAAKKSELKTFCAELEMIDAKQVALKKEIDKADRDVSVARDNLDKTKKSLQGSTKEKEYLLDLKKIFSPTGIRAYVFDGIIKDLNDKISKYLDTLSGGAIQFAFDSDDSKGKFTETCEYQGTKRSIGALSGGEFRRLSLAIDLGLADVVCSRISVYPNVLFLDEAFQGLDTNGREIIMDMLSDLIETKDAIYVVDHATELKTAFAKTFDLVKKNGKTSQTNETAVQSSDSANIALSG